jgi:peptidoglycan/xylan/chitin deacetylase (PgdA/CDA1 family)
MGFRKQAISIILGCSLILTQISCYADTGNLLSLNDVPGNNPSTLEIETSNYTEEQPSQETLNLPQIEIPTLIPTEMLTSKPTITSTSNQTEIPTPNPPITPTQNLTEAPALNLTETLIPNPTEAPTSIPTETSILNQTDPPTPIPIEIPTLNPTQLTITTPIVIPTNTPTIAEIPEVTPYNLNLSKGITIDEGDNLFNWIWDCNMDLSIDTQNYVSGAESLKVAIENNSTGYCTLEKHVENLFAAGEFENFEINMNIPDVSKIMAVGVAFFNDDVNYISYFSNYIGSSELANGWNKIRRSKNDFVASDENADWSKIKCMWLTFFTVGSEVVTVNIDRIAYNVKGIPKLMFDFEDGYYEVLSKAYPILNAKGFRANVMAIKSRAEFGDIISLDISELNYLYNSGWDIVNHTENHPLSTNGYSTQAKIDEYLNCKYWLLQNGWVRGADHIRFPSGFYDSEIEEIIKSIGAKTAKYDTYGIQPVPVENIYNMKTIKVGKDIPIDTVKAEINRAIATGSTISLTIFKVVDNPTTGIEVSKEYFKELVDFVYSKTSIGALDVVTISKWYEEYMMLTPSVDPIVTQKPTIDVPEIPVIKNFFPSQGKHYQTSEGVILDEFDSISSSYVVKRGKLDIDNNLMSGKASLRLSSQVDGGGSNIVFENHADCNYDFSDMENIEFNFYIPDRTMFSSIAVSFYSDDLFHNEYCLNTIGSYEFQNGWNKIVRRKSDFASTYGADWSKIKCFRITVYANAGCNPYINIDKMAYNVNGVSKMLFTFDDAWTDIYTKAYGIMEEKGFKGTAWAIQEMVVNGNPNFMSIEQLNDLYNNGWDIGNHTKNHFDNITVLSDEQKREQYLDCQNWLLSNNWDRGAYHVCYPSGSFDEGLINVLMDIGVKSARTAHYGIQSVPVENIYKLKCIPVGRNVSMDLIKHEIDKAVETGGTIMFMFHKVEDNPSIDFEVSTEDFKDLVDYINEYVKVGKTEVQTISQWYDGYISGN